MIIQYNIQEISGKLNCQSRNHALSAGGWEVAAGRRVPARGVISHPLPQRRTSFVAEVKPEKEDFLL